MSRELKHILIVIAVLCCAVFMRCANQMAPQGGPRDSLPPTVRIATPENGVRYFSGNRVYIEFDEYVQLQDQNAEFFTSPIMKTKPTLMIRGRGVRVDIKDTLLENQTYSLNFGSSIRDNNEGNPLRGFRYVFSTGGAIDSMLMTGYTADAMKGDSVGGTFVMFYDAALDTIPAYDSLLYNHQPSAMGRAEGNGIFIAQNLKDIPYRVYAVEDNNGNQTYEVGVDKVGFLDSVLNPANMEPIAIWLDNYRHYPTADPQVYFRMFAETTPGRQLMTSSERPGRHQVVLRFASPFPQIDTLALDSIPQDRVIREYMTAGHDTISLWLDVPPEALPDTIKGRISYLRHDSLGRLVSSSQQLKLPWRQIETREEQREREREEKERLRAEEDGEEYVPPEKPNPFRFRVDAASEVDPEKSIPIEFDLPLVEIDSARISIVSTPLALQSGTGARTGVGSDSDSEPDPEPVPFHIVRDTMNIRRWTITADWNEEMSYRLSIPAGVFVNVAGERNDSLGANFRMLRQADFATLTVNVAGKEPESKYILEVVDSSGATIKEMRDASTGEYAFRYIPEGEVRLRVTEDGNGNGKWDTGSLVDHRQPERVEFYVGPTGDQFIEMQLNHRIEANLYMATIFAPISIERVRQDLRRAEDARVQKYLQEKAERDAKQTGEQEQGIGAGGLGIGSALSGARQQVQSTVR